MPPPARPNTSMGFNRDSDNDMDDVRASTDDISVKTSSVQAKRPVAHNTGTLDSSKKSTNLGAAGPSQRPVSSFFTGGAAGTSRLKSGAGPIMRGVGSGRGRGTLMFGTGGIFGVPGRSGAFQKASRKTTLPSVMASPVKGSTDATDTAPGAGDDMEGVSDNQNSDRDQDVFTDQATAVENVGSVKGKGKERSVEDQETSRVSRAPQMLSKSLSSLPLSETRTTGLGLMGPPATPIARVGTRSASSSLPSSNTVPSSTSKILDGVPKTRSAMGLRSAPGGLGKIKGGVDGHVSSSRKQPGNATASGSSNPAQESLKVFKDCVVFVDVRTDDGDEVGSVFVEMLEASGARVSNFRTYHRACQ